LCSEDVTLKFHGQVKIYLTRFVQLSRNLYGTESQIMNMHSLIHLADDVKADDKHEVLSKQNYGIFVRK